ncbi:hypothetical protein L596_004790 [Steinernema carpocapsae]|nr:hypothetical protein L596_004790 [Steinernema carpocapsae]
MVEGSLSNENFDESLVMDDNRIQKDLLEIAKSVERLTKEFHQYRGGPGTNVNIRVCSRSLQFLRDSLQALRDLRKGLLRFVDHERFVELVEGLFHVPFPFPST